MQRQPGRPQLYHRLSRGKSAEQEKQQGKICKGAFCDLGPAWKLRPASKNRDVKLMPRTPWHLEVLPGEDYINPFVSPLSYHSPVKASAVPPQTLGVTTVHRRPEPCNPGSRESLSYSRGIYVFVHSLTPRLSPSILAAPRKGRGCQVLMSNPGRATDSGVVCR